MAKAKKISINAFEKVVKENFENVAIVDWHGLQITITRTISLQDVMSLVAEVTDNCFLSNGQYVPEVMNALLDCGVIERYTNINLPSNLSSRYELIMRSGILDVIMPYINANQYNDIVVAVRDKLDYACDTKTAEFENAVNKMAETMNQIQENAKGLFENVSADDIKTLVGAFSDERAIEERIVDEYIKKKNEPLKIVGEK